MVRFGNRGISRYGIRFFPNIGTVQQQTEAAKWCWQMWKSNNHCGPTCSHLASKIDKMELGSCEPLLLASVCSTVSSMKSAPSHDRDGLLDLFPARVAPCFREHCLSHSRNILLQSHIYLHHTAAHWHDLDYEPSCMHIAPATNVEFVLDS